MSAFNDGPILVAPRPVRVASLHHTPAPWVPVVAAPVATRLSARTIDALERLTLDAEGGDPSAEHTLSGSGRPARDLSPVRSSPTVASEAWEEFLAILKPAILQPTPTTGIFGAFRYATSPTLFKPVPDRSFRRSPRMFSPVSDARFDNVPARPRAAVLGSPVSRIHTRNPFQRQASHEVPVGLDSASSIAPVPEVSPRNVPLPSPETDEATTEDL